MSSFEVSAAARADLLEIGRYTEMSFGQKQRRAYLDKFQRAFMRLADFPGIGRPVDQVRKGVLQLSVGRHLVFYRVIDENSVGIIRVLHQSMDVQRWR